jgi:type VI secretion system FHA domain protein
LGAEAALQAFLDGAGVSGQLSRSDVETALRSYGTIFRAMTEGLRELLLSRSAVKGEFRIDQTMIRSNHNNPLKFSVTPEQAVLALLSTDRAGYMTPLVAAREALQDVKMHEIAVIAGVRSALAALLDRFDPAVLEARLSQGGLSNLVPAARKARLWNEFCELYGAIAAEAEDDFHSVFGRAFAEAYTEQSKARGGKPIA